jgi:hypothetical protein
VSVTTDRATTAKSVTLVDAPAVVRHRFPWLAVLVGALALLTVGVVAIWLAPRQQPAPVQAPWTAGYGPGSAVYAEQVPTTPTRWTDAYGPGSATYTEQVPAAGEDWTTAYGAGSSLYAEQVPPAARDWTTAYAPGTSTYRQQVPRG